MPKAGDRWMALEIEEMIVVTVVGGDDPQEKVVDDVSVSSEESFMHALC